MADELIVVGGGAAGMMAAISAAETGAAVRLLERNPKVGRKLYITGKGRCNVTNHCPPEEVLAHVGLSHRLHNFPAQLSGGEQQRVAIARALAKNPKLLLCDEPTGALDYVTGKAILKLLQDTCRQQGMTVIVITHNTAIAPMADKVIHVKNGQVEQIDLNPNPLPVEEIEW